MDLYNVGGVYLARKTEISKELILHEALQLLIREGYSAVNIKTLARQIGCSTQPIVWQFENMAGFRQALAEYALDYANRKMTPTSDNGFEAFTEVGAAYADIAFDEPELFKYLYLNGGSEYYIGELDMIAAMTDNRELVESIAETFTIHINDAAAYLTNSIIYSTGILSMIVSNVMKCDKEKAKQMIDSAGYAFLLQYGADITKAKEFGNKLTGKG